MHSYFNEQLDFELRKRLAFANARDRFRSRFIVEDDIAGLLATIAPSDSADDSPRRIWCLAAIVNELKCWTTSAPDVLTCTAAKAEAVAVAIEYTVRCERQFGGSPNSSLTAEFLHLWFPKTFPIFDAKVANSIARWSAVACHQREAGRADEYGALDIVLFHRVFWRLLDETVHHQLREAAIRLESILRKNSERSILQLTVLNIIDKLLQLADGDPETLGIALV